MGTSLKIQEDNSSGELRRLARRERGRKAARLYAIANALDGLSRAEAARLAGMERQALQDAVLRFNAEGPDGLADRPKGHRERLLTADEEAALSARVLRGPDPQVDGVCAFTRPDLRRRFEGEFGKTDHPSSLTRVLHRLGFSRQKARPVHPQSDGEAQQPCQAAAHRRARSDPSALLLPMEHKGRLIDSAV